MELSKCVEFLHFGFNNLCVQWLGYRAISASAELSCINSKLGWDGREIVVASDRSCNGMELGGMGCAGNSMYFNRGIHTLSY